MTPCLSEQADSLTAATQTEAVTQESAGRLDAVSAALDRVFREDYGRMIANLIRILGDIELAEDTLQDAVAVALERWPLDGVPNQPVGWLVTTARRKAIDRLRRATNLARKQPDILLMSQLEQSGGGTHVGDDAVPDDRLRLIFTCCHPALALDARVALTLRTLGGLTTPEIARAFLVPEATLAQRLVRAKRKVRDAGIPYAVPPSHLLLERLEGVLAVVYLIFNEGYVASSGSSLIRRDLCAEAIRLGRVLVSLMPDEPEVLGLLALMLLHDSRREARTGPEGELVTLEDQDRAAWDRTEIDDGCSLTERALRMRRAGPYQVQAAIAACHAEARTADATDWAQIVALYDALNAMSPSPVIELNRAAAVAMATGPAAGLAMLDAQYLAETLDGFHVYHGARADLLRRLGDKAAAAAAYRRALELVANDAERNYFRRRLGEVER